MTKEINIFFQENLFLTCEIEKKRLFLSNQTESHEFKIVMQIKTNNKSKKLFKYEI